METVIGDAPQLTHYIPELKGNFYHSSWETPEAFVRHIEGLKRENAWHGAGWDNGGRRDSFTGTQSMEEAIKLAKEGWHDGVTKVEKLRDLIIASNPVLPKPIVYGIAGSYPNVPRAIAGNPLNMRAIDLAKSRRRPVITLVCNMCDAWTVDKEEIINRAAVLAALIDQIEAKGYACEVVSTALTGERDYDSNAMFTAATSVLVKKSTQPVDIIRMTYPLGHASFYRRMVFADWGSHHVCKPLGSGLGSCSGITKPELKHEQVYVVHHVRGLGGDFSDEGAAKSGLQSMINSLIDQGCPAFADQVKVEVKEGKKKSIFDF